MPGTSGFDQFESAADSDRSLRELNLNPSRLVSRVDQPTDQPTVQAAPARLTKARRDAVILGILVAAVLLLIWNGSDVLPTCSA